jgi:N6-adenosine-specific RNA methylase IME4
VILLTEKVVNVTELVRYDAACKAIAEAKSIDEVKDVRDKAEAVRAYARQAKNKSLEVDAAEIRFRAEKRLGMMLGEQKKTVGLAKPGPIVGFKEIGSRRDPISVSSFSEMGIDKHLADRARKLAAIPDDKFEGMVGEWRDKIETENTKVTTRLLKAGEVAEIQAQKVVIPDGKFSVIVIDPPWPMEKIERDVAPDQVKFDYPTMDEAGIEAFPVPVMAADDCHLFMWTTHKFLPMSLRILEAWGFKYVLTMVWHKNGGFQPFNLPQYNCEFAVYARRGAPKFTETKAFFACFKGKRREHSRKPDEFYQMIERVTDGPRIDIFAREPREGFELAGNEVDKF